MAGEYKIRTPCCKGFGCFEANAIVRSGYYDPSACEIGTGNVLFSEECTVGSSQALEKIIEMIKP